MRPSVGLKRNDDGTWTAWIFSITYRGTEQECRDWIRFNGEYV